MNHEPECFYEGELDPSEWLDAEDNPCICENIAHAYQRGREDAAKAIESAIPYLNSLNMPTTPAWTLWESQLISGCIAAARGDGEQE